jgi:Na+-translocating ferredoxin:NAD+ oxidoreductase RnfG subunit
MFKKIMAAFLCVLALTLTACDKNTVEYPKTYGNVDVISAEETKSGVILTLETDGFHGTIQAKVTIQEGAIVAYQVVSHSESDGYGKTLIESGTLIQAFIDESSDLDALDVQDYLDAEAGATITGDALFDIALTALEHYNEDYK